MQKNETNQNRPKYTSFQNIRYILKMLWRGDKGVVVYSLFKTISENIFYVFFVVYMTKYIYTSIEQRTPFNELVVLISVMCGFHILVHFSSAGHAYYMKVRSPEIYRYIFGSVIDKACDMDYKEFERPEFYDKFTRAINESVSRGLEVLDNLSWFVANICAAIGASWLVIQVDPILLIFIVPSIAASLYFGAKAGNIYYQLDFFNTRDGRITTYVKRIFYEKKYASELRLYNIKHMLFKRHKQAVNNIYDRNKALRKKAAKYEAFRWSTFVIMSLALPFLYVAFVVKNVPGVKVAEYIAMAVTLEFLSWNISNCVDKMVNLIKNGAFVNNLHEFLDYEKPI